MLHSDVLRQLPHLASWVCIIQTHYELSETVVSCQCWATCRLRTAWSCHTTCLIITTAAGSGCQGVGGDILWCPPFKKAAETLGGDQTCPPPLLPYSQRMTPSFRLSIKFSPMRFPVSSSIHCRSSCSFWGSYFCASCRGTEYFGIRSNVW